MRHRPLAEAETTAAASAGAKRLKEEVELLTTSAKHAAVLNKLIPYRLDAVAALRDALRLVGSWDEPKTMEISFGGRPTIQGSSTAYTNPVIEAGLMHCRALLEFLGLRLRANKIVCCGKRVDGDVGIEDFRDTNGRQLSRLAPCLAFSHYGGDTSDAEQALVAVFHAANKGLAHITSQLSPPDVRLLEIASRGVPALVISHLYTPMGLPPPDKKGKYSRVGSSDHVPGMG
jgi:hypothetical protein